jgi:hypothetical protein
MYPDVACSSRLLYSIYTDREAQCNITNNHTQSILLTEVIVSLRMPIKICEDNNIHNIKYIRNNVEKKCPKFLRQNFGASLVFSISNHLTCRLSSAKCLELNIYTMLL